MWRMLLRPLLTRRLARLPAATPLNTSRTLFGFSRATPQYDGHTPLSLPERGLMAVTSAFGSLMNPRRADLINAVGETTATPYFIYRLRDVMLRDPTGRRILRDRPRLNSKTLPIERLRALPENSVGRVYAAWLDREGFGQDSRGAVKYIDDEECAYVMQRYRECHDFSHAITGLPALVEGEVALKAFEFANTVLPMTALSLVAVVRLNADERRRFFRTYLPWALGNGLRAKELINVYWEEQLERDVDDLKRELGIEQPPDLRQVRLELRRQRRKEAAAKKA